MVGTWKISGFHGADETPRRQLVFAMDDNLLKQRHQREQSQFILLQETTPCIVLEHQITRLVEFQKLNTTKKILPRKKKRNEILLVLMFLHHMALYFVIYLENITSSSLIVLVITPYYLLWST